MSAVTCPSCGEESTTIYRCDTCSRDLVETTTGGHDDA